MFKFIWGDHMVKLGRFSGIY